MKVDRGMPWVKREERKAKDKGVRVSWGLHGEMDVEPRGNQDYSNFPSAVSCDLSQLCGRSRSIRSFVVRFEESQETSISSISTPGLYRFHLCQPEVENIEDIDKITLHGCRSTLRRPPVPAHPHPPPPNRAKTPFPVTQVTCTQSHSQPSDPADMSLCFVSSPSHRIPSPADPSCPPPRLQGRPPKIHPHPIPRRTRLLQSRPSRHSRLR